MIDNASLKSKKKVPEIPSVLKVLLVQKKLKIALFPKLHQFGVKCNFEKLKILAPKTPSVWKVMQVKNIDNSLVPKITYV